uniref:Uncharacterized protein n=1 Tax=Rhizophagus irregularis (strain DAOM 181602 / DAOM 197198 / MUCL 43194) TaxID=747089 RepID=U9UUV6_RHIID
MAIFNKSNFDTLLIILLHLISRINSNTIFADISLHSKLQRQKAKDISLETVK